MKAKTLNKFFRAMPKHIRKQIEAVAMDMWDPFIKAVRTWCPAAKIVFDLFHVVKQFGKVIDLTSDKSHPQKIRGFSKFLTKPTPNCRK